MVHADQSGRGAGMSSAGADEMPTTLKTAAESYSRAKALSRATRNEYLIGNRGPRGQGAIAMWLCFPARATCRFSK
jgi:hypothetical protein